jgi:hypothetical protein
MDTVSIPGDHTTNNQLYRLAQDSNLLLPSYELGALTN